MGSNSPSFSSVVHLFLNLRGTGVSISPADLAQVEVWERQGIEPSLVEEIMRKLDVKRKAKSKSFPKTMKVIDQELRKFFELQESLKDG